MEEIWCGLESAQFIDYEELWVSGAAWRPRVAATGGHRVLYTIKGSPVPSRTIYKYFRVPFMVLVVPAN